jgi:C-terminal processing protease CtpA/Prc
MDMPALALLLLLALSACDAPEEHMRLATVDAREGLGMSLRELPQPTLASIGLGYGLAVIGLGAAAERAGLRLGDVVYGVNETKIRSLRDFSKAITRPADGRVSLLIRRGKTDLYVPLDVAGLRAPGRGPGDGNRLPLRQPTDTLLRT